MATQRAEHELASPRGVEAVKASLVAAAAELLAVQPASQVSGRAIARRARVNYGLIHQYFGSKEKIFKEVFLQLSERATAQARNEHEANWWSDPTLFSTDTDLWRIVANLVIDPELMESMEWQFPLIRAIAAGIAQQHPDWDDREVRAHTAALGATLIGWGLLQPIFQRGLELDDDELAHIRDRALTIASGSRSSGESQR
jgi:AcrR family transcriptional regulator